MRCLRTVRISVTGRCDLDCTYCNAAAERADGGELSADEIARIAAAARMAGARTVRLTGGEPLLREDLEEIVGRVRSAGVEEVALTTNAQELAGRAGPLREAGLDRVTIGLPSLGADSYRSITGGDLAPALAGLEA
ncbi:MAG: radical SAM protein, partial [Planctomycetota bacterium]